MKACRFLALLLAVIVVCSMPHALAAGVTYYVSPSGNDANNGTSPQTAFRTMAPLNAITYFPAGSRILFEGGHSYGGNLMITPDGSGDAPVEISSYNGVATLTDGGDKTKPILQCWNAQYLHIHDLKLAGTPGTNYDTDNFVSVNKSWAMMLAAGGHTQSVLGWIKVENVTIENTFGGIEVVSNQDATGYDSVTISNCTLRNVYQYGIFVTGLNALKGGPTGQHRNITIKNNQISDMHGDPYYRAEVQPINASNARNILIEGNTITRAGGHGGAKAGENSVGGSTGIGVSNCRNFRILRNTVSGMNSFSQLDASAIDADQDAQYGEIAYNRTTNNHGPSVQVGSFGGKTTGYLDIHHNVSYNDAQGNRPTTEQGAIRFFGNTSHVNVFNNTIAVLTWKQGTPSCVDFERHPDSNQGNSNIVIFNNVFRMARKGGTMPVFIRSNRIGGNLPSSIGPTVSFHHNAYDTGESELTISNDGLNGDGINAVADTYISSLADWQALGQGAGSIVGRLKIGFSSIDDTLPASDSPCIGAAVDPYSLTYYCANRPTVRALGATQPSTGEAASTPATSKPSVSVSASQSSKSSSAADKDVPAADSSDEISQSQSSSRPDGKDKQTTEKSTGWIWWAIGATVFVAGIAVLFIFLMREKKE